MSAADALGGRWRRGDLRDLMRAADFDRRHWQRRQQADNRADDRRRVQRHRRLVARYHAENPLPLALGQALKDHAKRVGDPFERIDEGDAGVVVGRIGCRGVQAAFLGWVSAAGGSSAKISCASAAISSAPGEHGTASAMPYPCAKAAARATRLPIVTEARPTS